MDVHRVVGQGPSARRRAARRLPTALGVVLAAAVTVGCTGGGGTSGACGPVQREPLDPRSVHVLPGAEIPSYRTDPPTSGPHLPGPTTDPVRDDPIAAPIQVGILEEGGVVIQHVGLSAEDRDRIEDLAGGGVVVAPAPALPDGAVVVATAWVTKQSCDAVDAEVLRSFVADHRDDGPGQHR